MWIFFVVFLIDAVHSESSKQPLECRLQKLRTQMKDYQIQAYIIPSTDDHKTEFVPAPDKRREFISGFTGSTGNALVTTTEALLWTDSRYYLQALRELPPSWKLVTMENSSTIDEWLTKNLKKGDSAAVDPKKMLAKLFTDYSSKLNSSGISFIALEDNLIDRIWTNRPRYKEGNIFVHALEFAGEPYERKLQRLRKKMREAQADLFVATKLDEIAWLLNLRGPDGEHTPTFVSYVVVRNRSATLYTDTDKVTPEVVEHLQKPGAEVEVSPYEDFWSDWKMDVQIHRKVLVPDSANYQIYSKVPADKITLKKSPLLDMKAQKNAVEVAASRRAHIKDAIALCKLYYQMEREVPDGIHWDEIKATEILAFYRSQQKDNLGSSFPSIVAYGKNGASPHYIPTPETNVTIGTSAPVTLDTGGQYLDGTIDTTRVWHFGTPTPFQKQVYTALLQGVADLATTVFPQGSPAKLFDFVIRRPLLKLGLTFGHGTTHGTGLFLEVHEDYNGTFFENFIGSQEPGYYKRDDFGMRLENLVVVVPAAVQNDENRDRLMTFSPLTLVPYESKLIDRELMDQSQVNWVNNYHNDVRKLVGDEMIKQRLHILYKWLMEKTSPI
uniref:Xaa-Pro aminopeptidase 1 n=2 Tax=Lygus hesperus TaxID=30085 RepID=A0A146LF68_LYGHE